MAQRDKPIRMADVGFVPTVESHTKMTDGYRLHTIDPDPERDIEIFDDDRRPRMVKDVKGS